MGSPNGRLRIGIYPSGSNRSEHCLGQLLRQRSDSLGRQNQTSALGESWIHTLDSPPNELKYRCHWTPPMAIDPFDHNTVYYGCQVIFKTTNGGQSWAVNQP